MLNNFNWIINSINIFAANDFKNNSWVFTILWFAIILSLLLSFMFTTSPIISVLSLLLLSISAVFLWFFETQFLFIYLVYILAFIGAVLMLFLSVVLMLPISMLRTRNRNFMSKHFVLFSFFINIDAINYSLYRTYYNFFDFITSGTLFLFIFISLVLFFIINIWNYIKLLRKFDLDFYSQNYSNFSINNKIMGYELLFLLAELLVAIKQNFLPDSKAFIYDRVIPVHNTYSFTNTVLGQLFNRSSISLSRIFYNLKVSNYSFLHAPLILENFITSKISNNKYLATFLNIYFQLDIIYSIFILRNKSSETLNLSNLNWKDLNSSLTETKSFIESFSTLKGLPATTEFYFSDYFLNKYSGILPNRFFFIFNIGFIPTIWNKFDFINLLYKPFTSIIPNTCNFNSLDFSLTKINESKYLTVSNSSIILKVIIFFEILVKVISSFWLFSLYVILGSVIPSFIFFGLYYDFYNFFKLDGYFFKNIYGFIELIIQSILVISIITCLLPSLLTTLIPENLIIINASLLKFTGLSSIKFLLYEFNGLSLILSTFVLLIALIGASTLTKK